MDEYVNERQTEREKRLDNKSSNERLKERQQRMDSWMRTVEIVNAKYVVSFYLVADRECSEPFDLSTLTLTLTL